MADNLYGTWKGYERFSWEWSEKQAELMEQFLDMEAIDVKGIIELLNEAHFHFFIKTETRYILSELMWRLADAAFYSKSLSDERYRMERELECRHFIFDLHNSLFFKDGTLRNEEFYNYAAEQTVAYAWKSTIDWLRDLRVQFPAECPWTLEQLVAPESLDFLLDILREKCSQSK